MRPSRDGSARLRVSREADAQPAAPGYGRAVPRLRPTDWIPAALLGAAALYEIWVAPIVEPGFPGPAVPATATALVLAGAVLMRRHAPLRALAALMLSAALQLAMADDPNAYQPSIEAFMGLMLTAYSVALHADRVRGIQALVLVLAFQLLVSVLRPSRAAVEDSFGVLVLLALLWAAATAVRARQDRIAELERDRDRDAAAAVTAERARIARELHDIVAHAVSVMVVQIGAARHTMRAAPSVAEESMQLAEAAGREALDEMRRLVGLMREDESLTEPTPGLSSLPALARRFEASGVPVRLELGPELGVLPAGLDLAAYRVVQEGLTNALKHAGPVPTDVALHRQGTHLHIAIRNGAGRGAGGGSGHGLVGLRERVALYGGTLRAGPDGDGFALRVELPL